MIEERPSDIEEPPSLDEIVGARGRVGAVDFSKRLRVEEQPAAEESAALPEESVASLRRVGAPSGAVEEDGPSLLILPPAKVDEAMAAEVARLRAEEEAAEAAAREEAERVEALLASRRVAESADHDDEDDTDPEPEPEPAEPIVLERPADEIEDDLPVEPRPDPFETLVIEDVADLEALAAERDARQEAARAAEETAREAREEAAREAAAVQAELAAQDLAASGAPAPSDVTIVDPAELAPPVEDVAQGPAEPEAELEPEPAPEPEPEQAPVSLAESVESVAQAVIAQMRATQEAHARHLEALENETARRCELLTAQAELDAELIRLHGRREAHAIIAAARVRAQEPDSDLASTPADTLHQIGETFSRFAESIEQTVHTDAHDHPGMP